MPQNVTIYRCLIICPSDVEGEKQALIELINHWNAQIGNELKVIVQPVHWGYATPNMSGPAQTVINKQFVDDCDIGIAVFWSRIGTKTAEHESGSVEEIRRLQARGCWIGVYFKSTSIPQERLKDDQFARLQEIKAKFEKEGLLAQYDSIDHLRTLVQLNMTSVIARLALRDKGSDAPTLMEKSTFSIANEFRTERLKALDDGVPKMVLHMYPLVAGDEAKKLVPFVKERSLSFWPLFARGHNTQSNSKGRIFKNSDESYVQLYRSGALESLDSAAWSGRGPVWGRELEETIVRRTSEYLNNYSAAGITPPVFVGLALLHVGGAEIFGAGHDFMYRETAKIEDENLVLPEFVVTDFKEKLVKVFKPTFDLIWQAAGVDEDPNIDDQGNWLARR